MSFLEILPFAWAGASRIRSPRLLDRLAVIAVLAATAGCRQCHASRPATELDFGPAPSPPARRIVTLAPSFTDLIVALGAADRIVGVTRFDEAPQVARAARVGGYSDPEPEAVLRVTPDLILCEPSPGNRGAVEALGRSGIPVVVLPSKTLADAEAATLRVGELLDLRSEAQREVQRVRTARDAARAAAARRSRRPKVVVLFSVEPPIAAGPGSFVHEMLEEAGADDIVQAATTPYPRISPEELIRSKPDALLLALMPGDASAARPIPGVDAPRLTLKSGGFMRLGPLVPEALQELTKLLDEVATGR